MRISLFSLLFGVFAYEFYLYIQKLKIKYEYSDKLSDVVKQYIKPGKMTLSEYAKMVKLFDKDIS